MKERLYVIVLALFIMSLMPVEASAYSASSAISYSNTYALSPNSMNALGEGYNYYSGSDCTNFTSQTLYAGGLSMDSTWKSYVIFSTNTPHRTDSATWKNANKLKNYLKNSGIATKVGSWSKNGTGEPYRTYAYVNNSNNLTSSNKGKTVLFYDWEGDGTMNHSAFLVANNASSTLSYEGSGDLINQHSTNRKKVLWRPDYRQSYTESEYVYTTRVYAFQLDV